MYTTVQNLYPEIRIFFRGLIAPKLYLSEGEGATGAVNTVHQQGLVHSDPCIDDP